MLARLGFQSVGTHPCGSYSLSSHMTYLLISLDCFSLCMFVCIRACKDFILFYFCGIGQYIVASIVFGARRSLNFYSTNFFFFWRYFKSFFVSVFLISKGKYCLGFKREKERKGTIVLYPLWEQPNNNGPKEINTKDLEPYKIRSFFG